MNRYLVKIHHPTLYANYFVINAADQTSAQNLAQARLVGTQWTITSIAELPHG